MKAHTIRYLCNLAWKNRQASASNLAQGLSVEICVSVTAQTVQRTLHEVNVYGRRPRRKPLLTKRHRTARLKFAKEHEKKPDEYWRHIL